METIITWAKENYDLISLGVGFLGVLIGIISVIQAKKQVKQAKKEQEASLKQSYERNIRQKIAEKRAELKVLESTYHVVDSKTIDDIFLRKSILSREIEELEKQL
jgi:hypothetical protein